MVKQLKSYKRRSRKNNKSRKSKFSKKTKHKNKKNLIGGNIPVINSSVTNSSVNNSPVTNSYVLYNNSEVREREAHINLLRKGLGFFVHNNFWYKIISVKCQENPNSTNSRIFAIKATTDRTNNETLYLPPFVEFDTTQEFDATILEAEEQEFLDYEVSVLNKNVLGLNPNNDIFNNVADKYILNKNIIKYTECVQFLLDSQPQTPNHININN